MRPVLVVAAHPDDAELAFGGGIALLTEQKRPVVVTFVTVSERDESVRGLRVRAAERAAEVLGHDLRWLADARLDQVEDMPEYELVRHVDALIDELRPAALITHWEGDSHGDHVRVARAVTSSSRRCPDTALLQFGPNEYQTHCHQRFIPNLYIPIESQLNRKIQALSMYAYGGQNFRSLQTESVEAMARAWGAEAGVAAAERLLLRRCVLPIPELMRF